MNRKYAFVFVCQQGELEIKSALLAASLKKYLRCDHELIACIPANHSPAPITQSFLEKLNVRIVSTGNEIDPSYLIANKIDCLRVQTNADKLIFLDSDMILMREFRDDPRFEIPFNARPASYPTFSNSDADWEKVYRACGLALPTLRIQTSYSGQYIVPYFNAAFIAVPGQSGFGDAWLECCKIIERLDIPNKRPYLDQIALAVAAAKLQLPIDPLDERFNHPINFKPLDEHNLPFFCHYHDVPAMRCEPAAVTLVQFLLVEYPDLSAILSSHPQWRALIQKPKISPHTPELIITGIPRSGTSYLCNLLHRHDNCVVLNEPVEAPAELMQETLPHGIARLFRRIRRDVLDGVPIRNKLIDGKVIEDTAVINDVQSYLPTVNSADFVLGIKATVAFLSRLPILRQIMPNARFVACIRNPLDCIASWKGTFEHLKSANVDGVNVGHSEDPWITGMQRKQLKAIAAIADTASRRAAWWDYMANLILDSRPHLILVNYDDLVLRPQQTLANILQDWPAGDLLEPVEPSQIRRRRENLDADDIAAVRALVEFRRGAGPLFGLTNHALAHHIPALAIRTTVEINSRSHPAGFSRHRAQKSGTTWLWENLRHHSNVFVPPEKELHYFNSQFDKPLKYYADLFKAAGSRKKGEVTPAYSILPVDRIAYIRAIMPGVRLIFLMRNPIERAWSHALMILVTQAGRNYQDVKPLEFIEHFRSDANMHRSDYETILNNWLDIFPREQLFLGYFQDIANRPVELLKEIFTHVGLHIPGDWEQFPWRQKIYAGPEIPMPTEYLACLRELYLKRIERLRPILGQQVDRWLDSPSALH